MVSPLWASAMLLRKDPAGGLAASSCRLDTVRISAEAAYRMVTARKNQSNLSRLSDDKARRFAGELVTRALYDYSQRTPERVYQTLEGNGQIATHDFRIS